MQENPSDKVQQVLEIFRACNVDEWASRLKEQYLQTALHHLDTIAVLGARKKSLEELANFLIRREH